MAWCGRSTVNINMENGEGLSEEEKKFEKDIKKETDKLNYYLGDTEELIESGDFKEMTIVCKRTDEILDRLNDLVSQMQEVKLETRCLHSKRSTTMEKGYQS